MVVAGLLAAGPGGPVVVEAVAVELDRPGVDVDVFGGVESGAAGEGEDKLSRLRGRGVELELRPVPAAQ